MAFVYRFVALYSGRWTVDETAEILCKKMNRKTGLVPALYETHDFLSIIEQLRKKKIFYVTRGKTKRLYLRNYKGKKSYSESSAESSDFSAFF